MRTPNYFLTEPFKELPAGACVRPVFIDYVPKETKEKLGMQWFDPEKKIICYTRLGFMIIRKDIVVER